MLEQDKMRDLEKALPDIVANHVANHRYSVTYQEAQGDVPSAEALAKLYGGVCECCVVSVHVTVGYYKSERRAHKEPQTEFA